MGQPGSGSSWDRSWSLGSFALELSKGLRRPTLVIWYMLLPLGVQHPLCKHASDRSTWSIQKWLKAQLTRSYLGQVLAPQVCVWKRCSQSTRYCHPSIDWTSTHHDAGDSVNLNGACIHGRTWMHWVKKHFSQFVVLSNNPTYIPEWPIPTILWRSLNALTLTFLNLQVQGAPWAWTRSLVRLLCRQNWTSTASLTSSESPCVSVSRVDCGPSALCRLDWNSCMISSWLCSVSLSAASARLLLVHNSMARRPWSATSPLA